MFINPCFILEINSTTIHCKGGKVVGPFHVNIAGQTHYSEGVNMQIRLSD